MQEDTNDHCNLVALLHILRVIRDEIYFNQPGYGELCGTILRKSESANTNAIGVPNTICAS